MLDLVEIIAKDFTTSFYGEQIGLTIPAPKIPVKGFPPAIHLAQIEGFSNGFVGCVHFSKPRIMIVPDQGVPLQAEECGFPVGKTAWRFGRGEYVTLGAFETFALDDFAKDPIRLLDRDIYCRLENVRFEAGSIKGTIRARVYVKEWGVTLVDWSHVQDFSIPLTVACIPIFDFGIVKGEACLQEVDLGNHRARICARGSYNIAGFSGTFAEACVGIGW